MNESELLEQINAAFREVPKPTRFTLCDCDECRDLQVAMTTCTCESLTDKDLRHQSALLSPAAFHYFVPTLVRLSLSSGERTYDLADEFIADLCQPIGRSSPPCRHPRATLFTVHQTAAVLAFLVYIRDNNDWESGQPSREIMRGISNWQRYLEEYEGAL
jgi:hypothetical protein